MDATSLRRIGPAALRYALLGLTLTILSGCNLATRLSEIGDGPEVSQIQNPMSRADYTPVSLPMPTPLIVEDNPNSLWRAGARAFFKDHRAKAVGDIVTVKIDLDDKAEMDNSTERERADTEDTDLTKFLGLELELAKRLPQGIGTTTTSFGAAHKTKGDGAIDRSEVITVKIAAVVTQILPNGALVLVGRQEILIN
ncbi:MAG: flagellar basal body L-ring protein FlgH, partial [Rhodospirillales bacterium]